MERRQTFQGSKDMYFKPWNAMALFFLYRSNRACVKIQNGRHKIIKNAIFLPMVLKHLYLCLYYDAMASNNMLLAIIDLNGTF